MDAIDDFLNIKSCLACQHPNSAWLALLSLGPLRILAVGGVEGLAARIHVAVGMAADGKKHDEGCRQVAGPRWRRTLSDDCLDALDMLTSNAR